MDYAGRLTFRSSVGSAERDAALMRRATWNYPPGIHVVAEYWPMAADIQVVTLFSADDIAAVGQTASREIRKVSLDGRSVVGDKTTLCPAFSSPKLSPPAPATGRRQSVHAASGLGPAPPRLPARGIRLTFHL